MKFIESTYIQYIKYFIELISVGDSIETDLVKFG